MAKIKLFTTKAQESGEVNFPDALISQKPNMALFAQAIHVYRHRAHMGLAKAKTRSEVDLTTKKVYKQKGTGNARHGAMSAPLYVGGGKSHGPRPVPAFKGLTQTLKKASLVSALTMKKKMNQMAAIEGMDKLTKTKEFNVFIQEFSKNNKIKNTNSFLFVGSQASSPRAISNLKNASYIPMKALNAYQVYRGGYLIFDSALFAEAKTPTAATKTTAKKTTKKETTKK